jgi:hypothetical protein
VVRLLAGIFVFGCCHSATGGPIDPYIPSTLRKLIDFSDVVLLAKQVANIPPSGDQKGRVQYTVVRVAERPQGMPSLSKGSHLELTSVSPGKTGELFLLTGLEDEESDDLIDWDTPEKVTQRSFKYILDSPPVNKPDKERLKYFLRFLDDPETVVVRDAYREISEGSNKDLFALADHMDRDYLRRMVVDAEQPLPLRGQQAMMLGVCGNNDDAKLLKQMLSQSKNDYWNYGAMVGYLLLTGEAGLQLLDETRLGNPKATLHETYGALMAVRCMGTHAPEKIERERLLKSLRLMLGRPDVYDLVIGEFRRWSDWSVQDRLLKIYNEAPPRYIQRPIEGFMFASLGDSPDSKVPQEVVDKSQQFLEQLRKNDLKAALVTIHYETISSTAVARFAFRTHATALLPKINRQHRDMVNALIADDKNFEAKRVPFAEAKRRVDAFTIQEREMFILRGKLEDLERRGKYWSVTAVGDSNKELGGYINASTGALVLLWFKAGP